MKFGNFKLGICQFRVDGAEEAISLAGNEMIVMQVALTDKSGILEGCKDWILPSFVKKIKHFCTAAGLMGKFDAGELYPDDCIGVSGYAEVGEREYESKDKEGNVVVRTTLFIIDYIVPAAEEEKSDDFLDDNVPF